MLTPANLVLPWATMSRYAPPPDPNGPKDIVEITVMVSDGNHAAETTIRGLLPVDDPEQDIAKVADELASRCRDIAPYSGLRWLKGTVKTFFHSGHWPEWDGE